MQEVDTTLKSIVFKQNDEFIDLIVHSEGQGYVVWIDNVKHVIGEKTLAQIIVAQALAEKTLRLLSLKLTPYVSTV